MRRIAAYYNALASGSVIPEFANCNSLCFMKTTSNTAIPHAFLPIRLLAGIYCRCAAEFVA